MNLKLSVEEATNTVYFALEEFTGWKFLKSQRCIKKKIGDVEWGCGRFFRHPHLTSFCILED